MGAMARLIGALPGRPAGKKVTIPGFGTFEQRLRAARKGRNPKTGEALDIPQTKSPAFSAGKTFKDAVKGISK